jgi:hypothetical protein
MSDSHIFSVVDPLDILTVAQGARVFFEVSVGKVRVLRLAASIILASKCADATEFLRLASSVSSNVLHEGQRLSLYSQVCSVETTTLPQVAAGEISGLGKSIKYEW